MAARTREALSRRWPVLRTNGEFAGYLRINADGTTSVFEGGRSQSGNMKSTGHSKRKNAARKVAKQRRKRNRG